MGSRLAHWDEGRQLVGTMGEMGTGVVEIAGEDTGLHPARIQAYLNRLKALAVESGVPVPYGMFSAPKAPGYWRPFFALADEPAEAGGRIFVQVHRRSISVPQSLEPVTSFDKLPVWRDIRKLPLAEQEAALRNPVLSCAVSWSSRPTIPPRTAGGRAVGAEARAANFTWLFPIMDRAVPAIARERGQDPVEAYIDLALEKGLQCFFMQPLTNTNNDHVLEMMRPPRSVITFSDSGAHVSQSMDSSRQPHLRGYWVREQEAMSLEEAVRQPSFVPASHWGLTGRGLLREGWQAEVVGFDPETVAP